MFKIKCKKCAGHGSIASYMHVENGICFECSGSGLTEVSKEEYQAEQKLIEAEKKGKYILFNNGVIEYYKTEKAINEKYGNFFSGDYGYSAHISYKDENIAYWKSTKNNDDVITAANQHYTDKKRNEIEKKISCMKDMLQTEKDQAFVSMITNKINELEGELASL